MTTTPVAIVADTLQFIHDTLHEARALIPDSDLGHASLGEAMEMCRALIASAAQPAAVAGPTNFKNGRCQHCIDRHDGVYGSWAPPCPYHDDDGNARKAQEATPSKEAEWIASSTNLNCPACGGSGHIDDVKHRAAQHAPAPDSWAGAVNLARNVLDGASINKNGYQMLSKAIMDMDADCAMRAVKSIDPDDIATAVCRSVAELPDRNSPQDWPEAMLVTADELHQIVREAVIDAQPAPQPAVPDSRLPGLLAAAAYLEGRASGYLQTHAYEEPDTGDLVFDRGESGRDYHSNLIELAEGIRALATQPQEAATGLPFGIIDPDYATAYTKARIAAWHHGYALALHGSFTRDLDLVAVPWADHACGPETLIKAIEHRTGLKRKGPISEKPHGRQAVSLLFPGFDDPRWVDLSIVPTPKLAAPSQDAARLRVVIDLLRDALDPLEVSAAVIESDDTEQMDGLIGRIKRALDQYDAARAQQEGK